MQELWIKQTIYRRLLIEEKNIDIVKELMLTNDEDAIDYIINNFDKNKKLEYDNDNTIIPFNYSINDTEQTKQFLCGNEYRNKEKRCLKQCGNCQGNV